MRNNLKYEEVVKYLKEGCLIWTRRSCDYNLHPYYYIETPKGNFYFHFQTMEKLIRNKVVYDRNNGHLKYRLIKN